MKFHLLSAAEMDASILDEWKKIRLTSALYDNPFFCPEYTQILAQVRKDVYLVVCEDAGMVCGVMPFHRHRFSAGVIGGFLTDYQGPLTLPGVILPTDELLQAMRTRYFSFNHMPADRADFAPYSWARSRSQIIDLSSGFDAYRHELEGRGSSVFKKIAHKERHLKKKMGNIHFTMDSASYEDFLTLLKGKSEQYVRTVGAGYDIFSRPWVRSAMELFHSSRNAEFSGMLSCLYVDYRLVAAHFGIRSGSVLHYWFPWYRTDYAEYSPGFILLNKCAMEAQQAGVASIDMGRGEQAFKRRFATRSQALCEGAISRPDWVRQAQTAYINSRTQFKESALGQHLVEVKRRMRGEKDAH